MCPFHWTCNKMCSSKWDVCLITLFMKIDIFCKITGCIRMGSPVSVCSDKNNTLICCHNTLNESGSGCLKVSMFPWLCTHLIGSGGRLIFGSSYRYSLCCRTVALQSLNIGIGDRRATVIYGQKKPIDLRGRFFVAWFEYIVSTKA